MISIDHIDHLVITVKNIDLSLDFYHQILGMEVISFGKEGSRKALRFGGQKINLHAVGQEFFPHAHRAIPGSVDICFITKTPIEKVIEHLKKHQVEIEEGPVERTGARKPLLSVYFRDPDQNLIEIANEIS